MQLGSFGFEAEPSSKQGSTSHFAEHLGYWSSYSCMALQLTGCALRGLRSARGAATCNIRPLQVRNVRIDAFADGRIYKLTLVEFNPLIYSVRVGF